MCCSVITHEANSGTQIDVSVNAPEAGTIKEFLANEEDTVTVGQDLVRLEAGETGSGEKQAGQEPKEPAPGDQKKSSDPQEEGEPSKDEHKPPPRQEKAPSPPKEDKAPPPSKSEKSPPPPPPSKGTEERKSEQPKTAESPFGRGARGENRVCISSVFRGLLLICIYTGENESHAPANC
jgi:2-oxoglutarate dehydrogenase E2 component (dihydrolipoamide succinyltransferase)